MVMHIILILTHTSQVPKFYKLCKNLEAFVQSRVLWRLSQVHPVFANGALAASICVGIVIPFTWLSIYITYS